MELCLAQHGVEGAQFSLTESSMVRIEIALFNHCEGLEAVQNTARWFWFDYVWRSAAWFGGWSWFFGEAWKLQNAQHSGCGLRMFGRMQHGMIWVEGGVCLVI